MRAQAAKILGRAARALKHVARVEVQLAAKKSVKVFRKYYADVKRERKDRA